MKHVLGVLAAAVVLAMPLPAFAQTDAAGEWELSMRTPEGNNTAGLSLNLDGDKVSGQLSSPLGAIPVAGTSMAGGVQLTADVNIQGLALQIGIDGRIEGDTMTGKVRLGDFDEFPFTGKRVAKSAAAAPATATSPAPASATAGAAVITDLNGKWNIVLAIAGMGEVPATALIKQTGNELSGTITSPVGEMAIAGTVTGRAVKIDFEAETPQGKLPITMTGDMGATSVTGKASIAGIGEADWTATRAAVQ